MDCPPQTRESWRNTLPVSLIVLTFLLNLILAESKAHEIASINDNYFLYPSEVGKQYQIQVSHDLVSWSNEGPAVSGRDGLTRHRIAKRGSNAVFYRVLESVSQNKIDFQLKQSVVQGSDEDHLEISDYDRETGDLVFSAGASLPERAGDNSVIIIPGDQSFDGVMARVDSRIQGDDGTVTLKTSSVTMSDLVETADIHMKQALLPEQVVSAQLLVQPKGGAVSAPRRLSLKQNDSGEIGENISMESEGYGFGLVIDDLVLYESEDGSSSLKLDGLVTIESPQFELDWVAERLSVEEFGLYIVHNSAAQLELSGDLNLADDYRKELVKIYFSHIEIGPLIFTPTLTVYVGYEYDINGDLLVFVDQQTYAKVGVRYTPEENWQPVRELYVETPDFFLDLEATVDARAYAGAAFEFLLYGLVGPYIGAEAYSSFSADYAKFGTDEPWWSMSAGYGLVLGVDADLFGFGDDFSIELAQRQERVLESGSYSREATDIINEEVVPEFWSMTFGGDFNEQVRAINSFSNGDILLVGDTTSFVSSPGTKQVGFMMGTDSSGDIQWQKSFGHQFSVLTTSDIQPSTSHDLSHWLVGSATTGKSLSSDTFITHVTNEGDFSDTQLLEVAGDGSNGISISDNANHLYVGGRAQLNNPKSSSTGWNAIMHQWDKSEDLNSWAIEIIGESTRSLSEILSIQSISGSGILLLVKAEMPDGSSSNTAVIKLASDHTIEWARMIESQSGGSSGDMVVLNDGSIVVQSSGLVVKLSGSGEMIWAKHLRAWLNAISTDGENIYLAGGTMRFPVSAVVAGLSTDGELDFSRQYIRPENKVSSALDLVPTADGGYAIAAEFQDLYRDGWLIKTLDEGSISFDELQGYDSDFASLNISSPETTVEEIDVEFTPIESELISWDLVSEDLDISLNYIHESESN